MSEPCMLDDMSDRNSKWIIYFPAGKRLGQKQRKQRLSTATVLTGDEELSPTCLFAWQWAALRRVALCSKHQFWSLQTCALLLSYATGYEQLWERWFNVLQRCYSVCKRGELITNCFRRLFQGKGSASELLQYLLIKVIEMLIIITSVFFKG